MDLKKINALNRLQFIDWSCSGEECEYVLAENTLENRQILLEAGFTKEELQYPEVSNDDELVLDLAFLAFSFAGATWFHSQCGFSAYSS